MARRVVREKPPRDAPPTGAWLVALLVAVLWLGMLVAVLFLAVNAGLGYRFDWRYGAPTLIMIALLTVPLCLAVRWKISGGLLAVLLGLTALVLLLAVGVMVAEPDST